MPSGCSPRRSASFASIKTAAEAPSDNCEALPAVMKRPSLTRWPSLNTGFSPARPSRLVSGRLPSSLSKVTDFFEVSPVLRSLTSMTDDNGAISSSKRPACCAAAVRCCERSEHRALARDVGALAALLQRRADDDVVDLARLDAGAPHRLRDGVPGERLRLSVVEGAAIGPADRRAGGGDNDGAAHELSPVSSYSADRSLATRRSTSSSGSINSSRVKGQPVGNAGAGSPWSAKLASTLRRARRHRLAISILARNEARYSSMRRS